MPPPVITVTRQYAAGGSDVARLVAAALDWTVIDNEFVDEVARRAGLAPEEVAERDERAPGLLERLARTLAVGSPELFMTAPAVPRVEPEKMEWRAGARWGALTVGLVLGCWRGPALAPEPPLAVIPFDPYGGAIYVPVVINGDSAWLMLDTGLSRTGLDQDWAGLIHATPVATAGQVAETASAVVDTIRLGDLELPDHHVALYPLRGLSEASGRLQQGLLGHDVLQRFTIEIDYPQRRVRLFDPARYHYAGPGAAIPFTPDADRPLLRASVKIRGRPPIPARLLLDTGASGLCMILTAPFVEQHGLAGLSPAIEAPIGTGLAGELHGTIARVQELRLGDVKVPSPTTGLGG